MKEIFEREKALANAQEVSNNAARLVSKAKEDLHRMREQFDMELTRGSKAERESAGMAMPELTGSHYDVLELYGFTTGSSVYSDAKPHDIDWVVNVPPHVFAGYAVCTTDPGYWEADGMTVIYANYKGQLLNIICISRPDLYKAWQASTALMTEFNANNAQLREALKSKWKRVRLFRALNDILYPVRRLYKPLTLEKALKLNKCRLCGREAINFIDAPSKKMWELDGECDRCREEVNTDAF